MRIWFPIALAACDSLAGPAYVGNPLITLRGDLDATGSPAGATALALLWQDAVDAGGPGAVSTKIPACCSKRRSGQHAGRKLVERYAVRNTNI